MKSLVTVNNKMKLSYGDHACLLYNEFQEYRNTTIKFIIEGLKNNDKVICIIEDYPRELLVEDLMKEDINVEDFLKSNQLVITSVNKIYINDCNPKKTLQYWVEIYKTSEKENFNGLRAIGEIQFTPGEKQETINNLIEYEIRVNQELMNLFDNNIYLCVFNKRKFPIYILEKIINIHPIVINKGNIIKPNPFYDNSKDYLYEYYKKIALRKYFSLNNTFINHSDDDKSKEIQILKYVLETTGDGIWEINTETNNMFLSETFYHLSGYNKEKIHNNYNEFTKLIHPEDINDFQTQINNCINHQSQYFISEVRIQKKSGAWLWLDIKGIPIEKDKFTGKVLKVVGIFNNITESQIMKLDNIKKEIELEKAKEYNEIKSQFISSISHDIKTPLNIILGVIQLQKQIHKDSNCANLPKLNKYNNMMKQNCYRVLRLINNLIDMTRVDSGLLETNLGNFNIISLVEDITNSIASYAEYQGIKLLFDTEIEEKIMAVDPDMIERIILNLLSNSLKFTEKGGEIQVNIYNGKNGIIISIKDSGIGIPKDKLNTIFSRFKQVNSKLSKEKEGSGLGLSLVKAFVEVHNGKITVDSEVGVGTKFNIMFPDNIIDTTEDIQKEITTTKEINVERINIEFSDIYSA